VSFETAATRRYRLLRPDGEHYLSAVPGTFGGNRRARIYGRLDCGSARAALSRGYAAHRVFFADEATAIAAGFRPCGNCMRAEYRAWKAGSSR
jgi:methylphosphotriester-DNA--protein-cysteine methyltransferase